MRKQLLVFSAVLVCAVMTQGLQAQATGTAALPAPALPNGAMKIAYVHSERLIAEAPGSKEASATIQAEGNKYRADLNLLEDSIQNMLNDYRTRQALLSPDAKKKQEDAIRAKETSLQQRQQQYEQAIAKRQQDLIKPIMDRINGVLEEVRKEGGYSIILNSQTGAIIAADTTLDLTNEILRRLKAAPAAPKK
jgi:outer membrane protein